MPEKSARRQGLDILMDLATEKPKKAAPPAPEKTDADDPSAPFAQGRRDMLTRRRNQNESGFSGDRNLPKPVDYLSR